MEPSHEKIIQILKSRYLTYQKIADATGLSKDGVRGRISELRSWGFVILDSKHGELHLVKDKPLIPFKIRTIKNPDNTEDVKVVIPLRCMTSEQTLKMESTTQNFLKLVADCKDIIKKIIKNKKKNKDKMVDVILNWEMGNILLEFQNNFIEQGFYLFNFEEALEKFIGKAGKGGKYRREYWRVREEFREMYPDKNKLMPWGWNVYNEIRAVADSEKREKLYEYVKERFMKTGNVPSVDEIRYKRHELGGTKKGSSRKRMENNL
jgi:biotin operon repressor